jgi:hypothetical protein
MTGIAAERVSYIQEEEDQEPTKIPVIKMEPKVSGVPVVSVWERAHNPGPTWLPAQQSSVTAFFFSDEERREFDVTEMTL